MGKPCTKETILLKGAQLIHEKGFNNTGLQEILREADVPKGSFYFYFKNKEDFGLQVTDWFASFILHMADKYLCDTGLPPLSRLERFFDFYLQHFENMNLRCGCPIGNLMQEMSDLSEPFREKISAIYDKICSLIQTCIADAQQAGDIPENIDAGEAAQYIFDSWEGAVMHMKLAKSTFPLITFKKMLFATLLKPQVQPDA
jgi:TetR/AcrR family transcriptional repressor of nem operon